MKTLLMIIVLISTALISSAQDAIIRKNGIKIQCNITSVDSINVYFTIKKNEIDVHTRLSLNEVEKILYDAGYENITHSNTLITYKKESGGYKFYQDNRQLKFPELQGLLSLNDKAAHEFKQALNTRFFASVFGLIGGYLVGFEVGRTFAGDNVNWTRAAIGGGAILLSIPVSLTVREQAIQAIDTYNKGFDHPSSKTKKAWYLV